MKQVLDNHYTLDTVNEAKDLYINGKLVDKAPDAFDNIKVGSAFGYEQFNGTVVNVTATAIYLESAELKTAGNAINESDITKFKRIYECAVGETVHVKDVNGADRDGTVKSIDGDMAQVDFGGGDVYGIAVSRLEKKGGATTNEGNDDNPDDDDLHPKVLAMAYKVNMDQKDFDELGKSVTRKKFKDYFGIPADADENPDYKRDADFDATKLSKIQEEAALHAGKLETGATVYHKEYGKGEILACKPYSCNVKFADGDQEVDNDLLYTDEACTESNQKVDEAKITDYKAWVEKIKAISKGAYDLVTKGDYENAISTITQKVLGTWDTTKEMGMVAESSANEGKLNEEKLIKGKDLTSDQKSQVLAAFTLRNTKENDNPRTRKALGDAAKFEQTDDEWVNGHSFSFNNDGSKLSGRKKYAEPDYMADSLVTEALDLKPGHIQSKGRVYSLSDADYQEFLKTFKDGKEYDDAMDGLYDLKKQTTAKSFKDKLTRVEYPYNESHAVTEEFKPEEFETFFKGEAAKLPAGIAYDYHDNALYFTKGKDQEFTQEETNALISVLKGKYGVIDGQLTSPGEFKVGLPSGTNEGTNDDIAEIDELRDVLGDDGFSLTPTQLQTALGEMGDSAKSGEFYNYMAVKKYVEENYDEIINDGISESQLNIIFLTLIAEHAAKKFETKQSVIESLEAKGTKLNENMKKKLFGSLLKKGITLK